MIPELKVPYLHEKQVERAANELLHKYAKEKGKPVRAPIDATLSGITDALLALPWPVMVLLITLLAWQFAGRALAVASAIFAFALAEELVAVVRGEKRHQRDPGGVPVRSE